MLSNLFVAIGAVVPLFCLMLIGVFVKRARLMTDEELVHMNRMVFRVFFFFMMFFNIYTADLIDREFAAGRTVAILVKGSHIMHMGHISARLEEDFK